MAKKFQELCDRMTPAARQKAEAKAKKLLGVLVLDVLYDRGYYTLAKKICHEYNMPWTDPRTGVTYQPPRKRKV
jgi:hypothetical protein